MITEDYVSFEIAKLLREKKFNERCSYVWILDKANNPEDTDGVYKVSSPIFFMEGESFVSNEDIDKVFKYSDEYYNKDAFLCPTLSVAMKWLRIEHNIHIEPHIVKTKCSYGYMPNYIDLKKLKPNFPFDEFDFSNADKYVCITYDKACEVTLKYCLEHLI